MGSLQRRLDVEVEERGPPGPDGHEGLFGFPEAAVRVRVDLCAGEPQHMPAVPREGAVAALVAGRSLFGLVERVAVELDGHVDQGVGEGVQELAAVLEVKIGLVGEAAEHDGAPEIQEPGNRFVGEPAHVGEGNAIVDVEPGVVPTGLEGSLQEGALQRGTAVREVLCGEFGGHGRHGSPRVIQRAR